jgi:hypothetical protein
MPLLRKPILKPIVGLDYMNPSTMINDRGGYPKNMRLSRDELKKREGISLFGASAITGAKPIIHMAQYPLESQSIRLVRFSRNICEVYNTATGAWDDITGAAFTGADSDFFSTTVAENKLIISNYVDKMRVYNDAGTTTDLTAADGTCPKAKFIEYNKGYLLAAYLDDIGTFPTKVKWTDIGDITKWGSGNYGSSLLYHDPLPIRGMKNLNENTIVYKKNSIYSGRNVDTDDIFIFDLVYTGVGLMSNRALIDQRGVHYFMGVDDFYTFRGIRPESIADSTVKREVFGRLDSNYDTRCFALLMTDQDEIWFFIVTTGNTWPTEIWKYNYRTGFWYYDTCSSLSAAALYYQQASVAWNDVTGTWDSQGYRWDDRLTTTNSPIAVIGDSSGFTYKYDTLVNNDNGVAIDASWESMDFTADKFEQYKRWLELDFEAKGSSLKVWYSTDYGSTWKYIKEVTLTSEWAQYKVYFDVVARNVRFKFSNNTLGQTFYLRQFYPYYLFREEVNR